MNELNYTKIIRALEDTKEKNIKDIVFYDERYRMSSVNQRSYKFSLSFGISFMVYIVLLIISAIAFTCRLPLFTNFPKLISLVSIGGSIILGPILTFGIFKAGKVKSRLLEFTDKESSLELLEEEIKYKIEIEKLNKRNSIIDEVISFLRNEENAYNLIKQKCSVNKKGSDLSKEELNSQLIELNNLLQNTFKELDLLITKSVLEDKFHFVRSIEEKIKFFASSLLYGVLGFLFLITPSMIIQDMSFLNLIINASIVISLGSLGVNLSKNRIYKKVFKKLNDSLEKDALPYKSDDLFMERNNLNYKISNISSKIVNITIKIKELESLVDDYDRKDLENGNKRIDLSFEDKIVDELSQQGGSIEPTGRSLKMTPLR